MKGLMPESVSGTVLGQIAGQERGPMPQTVSGPSCDLMHYPVANSRADPLRDPVQDTTKDTPQDTM
jgi:hypothetical protein